MVRVRREDNTFERNMRFYQFLISVPRTFVDYCTNTPGQQAMNYYFECPTKLKTSRGRKRITLPILIDYDILEAAKCHQQLQIRQFKTTEDLDTLRNLATERKKWKNMTRHSPP